MSLISSLIIKDLLPNLSSFGNGLGELDEGFFPVTPDVPRRGNSSIGLGAREQLYSGSPHLRMSTGNLRSKYRPRDNILMAGPMDLVTVTQQTGAQGIGGFRSAVRPRDQLSFPGEMELLSSHTDYNRGGHGTERRGSCQPKNHLKLDGSVEYRTNSHDFKGTSSSRVEIEKPRNHLQSTGNLELKTTTSEAFLADRRAEKMEKIKRDNLKISGERILKTTHNDFKHFGDISSSEIRAIPPWFTEPKSKQIIIS